MPFRLPFHRYRHLPVVFRSVIRGNPPTTTLYLQATSIQAGRPGDIELCAVMLTVKMPCFIPIYKYRYIVDKSALYKLLLLKFPVCSAGAPSVEQFRQRCVRDRHPFTETPSPSSERGIHIGRPAGLPGLTSFQHRISPILSPILSSETRPGQVFVHQSHDGPVVHYLKTRLRSHNIRTSEQ